MRVILIAAKELAVAKTRLRAALCAADRVELARAMFCDVLRASSEVRCADQVAVVSSDPDLLQRAHEAGAIAIDEEFPRGLNAAVRLATSALMSEGASSVCTLLSDIPCVMAADIEQLFAVHDRLLQSDGARRAVALAPSHDLTGTNMIVRAPADVIPIRFGSQSLARHIEECRAASVRCEIVQMARPALDLDVVEDLGKFVRFGNGTHTRNQLARLGLPQF
ncbi:MAG TPA: 2-phospho-L-lactate guanylyltransferase [Candidatus Binataceae bacterium]